MPVDVANVTLWGRTIAAVAWIEGDAHAAFEFTPEFQSSGIEVAPRMMPLAPTIYTFPGLASASFYGLPGMLADSLPDKFGNALIDQWLVRSGRDRDNFSPIERLCYVGSGGMGALEFEPALRREADRSVPIDIAHLTQLAADALAQKERLDTRIAGTGADKQNAIREILRVGTSAGGARAKAVIAWNEATNEVRSGQVTAPDGFSYWLLKFDGVTENRDKELADPRGYGRIEYAYHLMAREAGVEMSPCRLLEENDRSHFMTKRFDRSDDGSKIFMQSLCALGHYDFNRAGAYSYEQAIEMCQLLDLDIRQREQLFRRAVFNIMSRNQDDHTKNIAFLMDKSGRWRLAPAFDIVYSYNPAGQWTSQHQMSFHGKLDHFDLSDIRAVANRFRLYRGGQLNDLLDQIDEAINRWPVHAERSGVPPGRAESIAENLRPLARLKV